MLASLLPAPGSLPAAGLLLTWNVAEFFGALVDLLPGGTSLIVVLDEVSAVPVSFRTWWYGRLRAAFNMRQDATELGVRLRRVAFAFAGTFNPLTVIDRSESQNSPFNISTVFDTADYDFAEADIRRLCEGRKLPQSAIDDILPLTNGHPYLAEALAEELLKGRSAQDGADALLADDLHLAHVAASLVDSDRELVERLAAGQRIPHVYGSGGTLDELMTSGIVNQDSDGYATFRCQLYKLLVERISTAGGANTTLAAAIRGSILEEHIIALMTTAQLVLPVSPAVAAACAGAALEGALLLNLEAHQQSLPAARVTYASELVAGTIDPGFGKLVNGPTKWRLAQLIEVARILGLFSVGPAGLSHVLRDWRNLIHPANLRSEYPGGVAPELAVAAIANARLLMSVLPKKYG
jgi:hypothetical protein